VGLGGAMKAGVEGFRVEGATDGSKRSMEYRGSGAGGEAVGSEAVLSAQTPPETPAWHSQSLIWKYNS
jgi:hypothetical protein